MLSRSISAQHQRVLRRVGGAHGSLVAPHRVQKRWPAISGLWQLLHDRPPAPPRRDLLDRRDDGGAAPAARLASVAAAAGASASPTGVPQAVQKRDLGRSGARHLTHMVPPAAAPFVLLRFFLRLRFEGAAAGGGDAGVGTAATGCTGAATGAAAAATG